MEEKNVSLGEDKVIHARPRVNSGVILEPVKDTDYIMGGFSPFAGLYPVIFPNGHGWLTIQRPEEKQYNSRGFDSYSCVTFASLKALSYYFKVKFGMDMDFSERFTAVMSGTVPGQGNSVRNVLESIRKDGFVLESDYPSMSEDMTQAEWFAPIPQSIKDIGKKNMERWAIHWEALSSSQDVPHDLIKEALKHAPVIVTGFAWASYYGEGIFKDYNNQANHCFDNVDFSDTDPQWDILADDTYPLDPGDPAPTQDEFLKKLDKTYRIWSAHRIWAEEIATPKTDLTLLNKIRMAFKKISRTVHGGLVFIKKLADGNYGYQEIKTVDDLAGALIDEVGVEKNNLSDDFIKTLIPTKFFGK